MAKTLCIPSASFPGPISGNEAVILQLCSFVFSSIFSYFSKVAIFPVDSKLFKIIEKPLDKFSLQQDLTQLSIWSDTWEMCLSIPKCNALNISRKKIPTKRKYHLTGTPLATVNEIKDLGITVTNTLQWSQHIKQISSKANRTLGLIPRVCRDY